MSGLNDFQAGVNSIERILEIGEYGSAATECVKLCEQALRQVAEREEKHLDKAVRQKIHDAARRRTRGKGGFEKLTMGQMVHVMQEAGFLDAWAQSSGKDLSGFAVIDLTKLTQLRNELMHNARPASRAEAQFLLHCLHIILDSFDLNSREKTPEAEAKQSTAPSAEERADRIFQQGHALVIGIGADLSDTVNDAHGLAKILRNPERCAYPPEQVEVLTETKATRSLILGALDSLAQRTGPDASVIIYFSGHGYQVRSNAGEVYYLMPYGYNMGALRQTAVSGAEFADKLRAIPARKLLVLLDCCHAGGVGDVKAPDIQISKSPLPAEVLPLLEQGRGRVLIASSKEHELSYAGKPYSAFTLALIEALCGQGVAKQDGYVRVADLALHAREVVPGRTRNLQHPVLHFEHADNFALAYYAGGDTQPKSPPFQQEELHTFVDTETAPEISQPSGAEAAFDYDIFISFADVDDLPRRGAKEGWVTTFIRELRSELAQTLGRDNITIWSPHQLPGHVRKHEEIRDKQQRSATFLVVLSRGYLNSEWCTDPKIGFFEEMKRLAASGRVFLLERDRLEGEAQLDAFQDLQGYKFWVEDPVRHRVRTMTPQRDPDEYYDWLGDLCEDVVGKLGERVI